MATSAHETKPPEAGDPNPHEIEAYKEATRVMFGFRDRTEVQELFRHRLVWNAMRGLEKALEMTRAQGQPDEFALALAIERELLDEARKRGADLQVMFNDPSHHKPPSDEITRLVTSLWDGEPGRS